MEFKNIQNYCLLIGFEGMDASYKETNSKALVDYIKEYFKDRIENNELDVLYFSFPNYESESSYFVRQYLAGKYKNNYNLHAVTYFYLMDMYDTLNIELNKPTVIIFDRYYYSQMYYLTKFSHAAINERFHNDPELIKKTIDRIEVCAEYSNLPKLNFLFKMYNDLDTMVSTIKKRSEEKGKPLDEYEKDIEYLKNVRELFLSDKFINKSRLNNITGNKDILYNINVSNKDRDRVWDDVRVAINNTLINYKKILDKYYEKVESKEDV